MGLTLTDDMVEIYRKSKTRNAGTGLERMQPLKARVATLGMILSNSIATFGQWLSGTGSGLSYGNKARN